MSNEVFYCYDDEDIDQVARYMQEKEVRRMLILNRQEKKLTGVVSLGDIAKASGEKQLAGETLGSIAEAA
jgi:CBS domain-containing protein